jgi:GNAT superfamily N-acetyltransferase
MPVSYRSFARGDIATAHELSLEVGWPHRVQDWEFVQRLGAGYVAHEQGRVIGTMLFWRHDRRTASLGMVIVSPAHQGQGIGSKLMSLALDDLQGRSVYLTATAAGQPMYERYGFQPIDTVQQHQGNAAHVPLVPLPVGERLRPVGKSDAPRLASLATRAAGFSRTRVVSRLLEVSEGIVLDRGGEAIGFALFRRFGHGYVIGPTIAPDARRAKVLISHWAALNPQRFLRVDVQASTGLGDWIQGLGLKNVGGGVTMVKGKAPAKDARVGAFSLINQAIG